MRDRLALLTGQACFRDSSNLYRHRYAASCPHRPTGSLSVLTTITLWEGRHVGHALRLRHHRRRLGGLRAGRAAERGSGGEGAAAGGRGQERLGAGAHARRRGRADQGQGREQLGLLDRGRAASQRSQAVVAARPGPGRQLCDQRHDLHPRPRARLRPVAADGPVGLVLRRGAALLQTLGDLPRRRLRLSRRRRAAARLGRRVRQPVLQGGDRGRPPGGPSGDQGLQRLPSRRALAPTT